jgi:GDP-L-fucose synthase
MTEDMVLTGLLEPTNEGYAVAKLAGLKLVEKLRRQCGAGYVSILPSNVYGLNDNYDALSSHVPAALIRRFDEAKRTGRPAVTIWGTGRARREFLSSDDVADAALFVLKHYSADSPLKGSGYDISICDFAQVVAEVVGYAGAIRFDASRPDGMPRKLLDISATRVASADFLEGGAGNRHADYLARRIEMLER